MGDTNKYGRPLGGRPYRKQPSPSRGLLDGTNGLAALDADGADVDGLRLAVEQELLFLEVRPEGPLGSPVGVAVGVTGNGLFAAKFAFVRHSVIIPNQTGSGLDF